MFIALAVQVVACQPSADELQACNQTVLEKLALAQPYSDWVQVLCTKEGHIIKAAKGYQWSANQSDRVYLNDTELDPVDQDLLKLYLTKVLAYDNYNFSIILGIDAYCEDNYPTYDRDTFYDLRIKNFSLTFTYEKKIDQLTTVSYEQTGDVVTCTAITNASMSFDYSIDTLWTTDSPNSEIQTIINGKKYSESVNLADFTTTDQTVEYYGVGLKDLLTPNLSISVKFQLYIGDEFENVADYTISIDNVHFKVSYMVFTPDPPPLNYLGLTAGLGGAVVVLSTGFLLYQTIFKYPIHVRKIRNIRRKIRKGGSTKPLKVQSRTDQISSLNKFYV